jgi:hypothetical protein
MSWVYLPKVLAIGVMEPDSTTFITTSLWPFELDNTHIEKTFDQSVSGLLSRAPQFVEHLDRNPDIRGQGPEFSEPISRSIRRRR